MGTTVTVTLRANQPERLATIRPIVAQALTEIETDLSIFRPNSTLAIINATAGHGTPILLSTNAANGIALACHWAAVSQGAFDPTIGPLMNLWGFRSKTITEPPTPHSITQTLSRIGWTAIHLHPATATNPATAHLTKPGMHLDLGGIAKGQAVDLAWHRLRLNHQTDFLIDLGGNMRVHGTPHPSAKGWRIGIRNPFTSQDHLDIGTIILTNGQAVATSGNYEQYVELNGKRYTHIIDPRTGWPVSGIASVTVVAPDATTADALSTTLFVIGPQAGLKLLQTLPGCHALWIPDTQPISPITSPGLKLQK